MRQKSFIFFVFVFILLILLGCADTEKKKNNIGILENNIVENIVEESKEKQEERKTNERIKTQEINESQPSIEIVFAETTLYVGQQAKINVSLYKNGAVYPSTQNDFMYTATYGTFQNKIYTAPKQKRFDTITIKYLPTNTEKAINVPISSFPKIEVDINSVLSCNDHVAISPQVYIEGNLENYPLSSFVYSAKHGLFTEATYRCPEFETEDTILISYPALKLEKKVQVTIKAKPVLTAKIPISIIKGERFSVKAYMKKAQNRSDISIGELSFSSKIGVFEQATYIARKIGKDTITITHNSTGQKIEKNITIKDSFLLKIHIPKYQLENFATMEIKASMLQGGKVADEESDQFLFTAEQGIFENNKYKAPEVSQGSQIFDTITITHKKTKLSKKAKVKILYSEFRTIKTDFFSMPVPSKWNIETIDMGLLATSYEGKFRVNYGSEIKALALSGFNFLEPQTVMVLFQQQGGIGKHMQKVGEESITIAGEKVTKMIFESDSQAQRKSWWIIFKKNQVLYLLTISGEKSLFQGNNSKADQMLSFFQFEKQSTVNTSLKMSEKIEKINKTFFEMELPESWKADDFFGIFFAMSTVSYKGETVGSFLFAHRSREIQSMDLSLILILFRQEIVKDPKMIIGDEQEIEISGIKGKMIEFTGGKGVPRKMWLIALKHNYTGYVIVINGPQKIWDANPDFAEKIKNSFRPK